MKQEHFNELLEEVEDFIASHDFRNRHYLPDENIIEHFKKCRYGEDKFYKKKHILKAINELR